MFDTLNINNPMKVSNNKCKLKYYISTMIICGSYMFEFSVSKDMDKYTHTHTHTYIYIYITMIKGEFQHIF